MSSLIRRYTYSKRAKYIALPLFVLAIINFFSFIAGAVYLGGSAMVGYAKDGHYFLSQHGQEFTETSKGVWLYSHYHGISMFITQFSAIFVGLFFQATGDIKLKT